LYTLICAVQCETEKVPILGKLTDILPEHELEKVENHFA